jgi:Mg2+-importing ATPase
MESVVSAALIVLVVRTRRPFFRSKPGKYLVIATLLVVAVTIVIPFTPLSKPFGFQTLPASFFLALAVIVAMYIGTAELAKRLFYRFTKQL